MTPRTIALFTPYFDATLPSGGVQLSMDVAREWVAQGHRVHVLTSTRERQLGDLAEAVERGAISLYRVVSEEQVRFTHVPFEDVYEDTCTVLDAVRPDIVHIHNTQGMLSGVRAALDAGTWPCMLTALDYGLLCFNFCLHNGTATPCTGPESVAKCRQCLARGGLRGSARWAGSVMPTSLTRRIWPHYVRLEHFKTAADAQSLMRSVLMDLDAIIAPSPGIAQHLVRYGARQEQVHEILYGVSSSKRVRPAKSDSSVVRLAFFGGSSPIKGLDVLLQAAALLPEGLALELRVFGGDVERRIVETAGPATRRYVRHSPRLGEAFAVAQAEFDAVLVPSQVHENSPLVILEAFANGTPVIAADQIGIRHLVHNGHNGWLVPASLPGAWARTLERAATCRDQLDVMREFAVFSRTTADFVNDVAEVEAALLRTAGLSAHARSLLTHHSEPTPREPVMV